MKFFTKNPATGEKIEEFTLESSETVFSKIDLAQGAYNNWSLSKIEVRQELLYKLAGVLEKNCDHYAGVITAEMGKVLKEAKAEVQKCATLCRYYADNLEEQLASLKVEADGQQHLVAYESLGIILTIMPWNFPFWQAFRFAVPAIAVGNVAILKHSNVVARSALLIQEIFEGAGFAPGIFQTVITSHDVVAQMAADDRICGISFTGSTEVGKKVAQMAGTNLKKMVLELGGSDPFIVLDDADVEKAAQGALLGRLINAGQSCIAAKRFIVMKGIAEQFSKRFIELMSEAKVGDPLDEASVIGPLVDEKGVKEIEAQVRDALNKGAKLECGKESAEKGFFAPVVLSAVNSSMRVMTEEVFGPVAPIMVVESEQEAIEIANGTEFGLGASVWSEDRQRASKIAFQIQAGTLFINSIVKSDPRMPFGGTKKSGIGRELSHFGLHEFVNIKGYNIY